MGVYACTKLLIKLCVKANVFKMIHISSGSLQGCIGNAKGAEVEDVTCFSQIEAEISDVTRNNTIKGYYFSGMCFALHHVG